MGSQPQVMDQTLSKLCSTSVFHLLVASQGAIDIYTHYESPSIYMQRAAISSAAIQQSREKDLNLTIIMFSVGQELSVMSSLHVN